MPIVIASSFADPKDLREYQKGIKQGRTEKEALEVGDNCIGCWGDRTGSIDVPMCALPPDDWLAKWGPGSNARGKKVAVTYRGKTVIGELRDTMKSKARITNGAGIDLNPGFARSFGLAPPFLIPGLKWEWV